MAAGKYGKNNQRQSRRQLAEAKRSLEFVRSWSPAADEPTEEQTVFTDVTATTRITQRTVRYERTGMLSEFAVTVSEHNGCRWTERLCIDSCNHGTVHRHKNGDHKSAPDVIRKIESANDIQQGLSDALTEAYDLVDDEEEG